MMFKPGDVVLLVQPVLQMGLIVVGGYGGIWAVNKVISLIAHDDVNADNTLYYYAPYSGDDADISDWDELPTKLKLEMEDSAPLGPDPEVFEIDEFEVDDLELDSSLYPRDEGMYATYYDDVPDSFYDDIPFD